MTIQYFLLILLSEFIVTIIVGTVEYFFIEKKQRKETANYELRMNSRIDKIDQRLLYVEGKKYILENLIKK